MAITSAERSDLLELTILMFDAAPGANYLALIVEAYEDLGHNMSALANVLAETSIYQALHPNFQTAEEFAADLTATVGLSGDAFATNWVVSQFNAGVSKAQISYNAWVALNNLPAGVAPQYTAAAEMLANKTEVSLYYSVTVQASASDVTTLQEVIDDVTADDATVTTAKAEIDGQVTPPGQGLQFTLTVNQDSFTGTAEDDTFNAGAAQNGAGALINTLQNVDVVNGGNGNDTLNITLGQDIAVAATITAVENVSVRFANTTADAATLSLSNATGVSTVTVANSTVKGNVTGVGAAGIAVGSQKTDVDFDGITSTTLALSANSVGTTGTGGTEVTLDLGVSVASKSTALNLTVANSNINIVDTTGGDVATSATIAATGTNEVKFTNGNTTITTLTVTGAGSVNLDTAMTALKTLTVADGGVTVDATGGVLATVTTGGGKDKVTLVGATASNVSTGAGNDTVSVVTSALGATANVNLGAGDDTLTLSAAPTKGVTLNGGDGTDTIGFLQADYGTVTTGFSAAELALISNFEVLSITDALVTATYDVSKLSGVVSFKAAGGITAGATATIAGLGAGATVTLAGANTTGAAVLALKDSSGTADALTLVLNQTYAENNDATSTVSARTQTATATGIENLTVQSTGTPATAFAGATGTKADTANNTLALTNVDLTNLTVTGDQAFTFTSAAAMTKLTTINGSANTGGLTIDVGLHASTSPALTITGSATAANTISGSVKGDTIVGGAKADMVAGEGGADTITLGAGNDMVIYTAAAESTLIAMDVINDFSANTYGNGTDGAAGTGASADATKWTGDVLEFDVGAGITKAAVGVFGNATDAQVFLQNTADASTDTFGAALDSTTGKLYADWNSDGTVDSVIQLTGVTTLTAAAIVLF